MFPAAVVDGGWGAGGCVDLQLGFGGLDLHMKVLICFKGFNSWGKLYFSPCKISNILF